MIWGVDDLRHPAFGNGRHFTGFIEAKNRTEAMIKIKKLNKNYRLIEKYVEINGKKVRIGGFEEKQDNIYRSNYYNPLNA